MGFQVCKSDGTYDVCNCGVPSDSGGTDVETDVATDVDSSTDGNTASDVAPDNTPQNDAANDVAQEATTTDGSVWTSPASFSGLALWLDDTVGVVQDIQKPGYVRRWLDQSGNSNTADVPGYLSCEPSIDPAALNNHDAIVMAYSSCCFVLTDAPSLQFGTGDFLIGAVVKVPYYITNDLTLWGKNNFSIYQDTSNNFTMNILGTKVVVANPDTTKFHIVIVQGAAMKVYVDGSSASGATNTTDISAVGYNIGVLSGANNYVAGYEVAEMVAVKGTVSSANVTNLQNYWKQKFKL